MDIGCGLILQNCLAERKRRAAGEMKEREKVIFWKPKSANYSLFLRPVAECHDCKKHEDSADADNEDDHHDHRVTVALFHYSHKDKRQACGVQKNVKI